MSKVGLHLSAVSFFQALCRVDVLAIGKLAADLLSRLP
jgi:hypothetical protein